MDASPAIDLPQCKNRDFHYMRQVAVFGAHKTLCLVLAVYCVPCSRFTVFRACSSLCPVFAVYCN